MKTGDEKAGKDANSFPATKSSFLRRWNQSVHVEGG